MSTDEFRAVHRLGECRVNGRVAVVLVDRQSGPSPLVYLLAPRMWPLLATVSLEIPEAVALLGPLEFFVDDAGAQARLFVPLLASGLVDDTLRRGPARGSAPAPAIWKIREAAMAASIVDYVPANLLPGLPR